MLDRSESDEPASGAGPPTASLGDSVARGARLLASSGSDVLVVLGPRARPWGVVSCRDLVVRCLAAGRDPDRTSLSELLMADPAEPLPPAPPLSHRLEPALGILRRELERLGGNGAGPDSAA